MNLQAPLALCSAVHTLSLMVWFGALVLPRLPGLASAIRRAAPAAVTPTRAVAALALVSGVLWPMLQTGVVLDDVRSAWDPSQVAVVLGQTSFGRVWVAREILVACAFAMACIAPGGRAALWLVGGALGSMALLGHAAGVPASAGYEQRGVLAVHLLAAGAWVGALPVLWCLARVLPGELLASAMRRFSSVAIGWVALVVLTGSLSAWWRTGTLESILYSNYSHVLLGKLGLVLLMGVAALLNRNRFTPALQTAGTAALTAHPQLRPAQDLGRDLAQVALQERPTSEPVRVNAQAVAPADAKGAEQPDSGAEAQTPVPRIVQARAGRGMTGIYTAAPWARRGLVASIATETVLAVAVVVLAFFLGASEAPR
jgi:putative copper resistance protein D